MRAVRSGDLLSPDLPGALLSPQVVHGTIDAWTHMCGLRSYVDKEGKVFCHEKEGMAVGVSAVISHFQDRDITVSLPSNMEDGAWDPREEKSIRWWSTVS